MLPVFRSTMGENTNRVRVIESLLYAKTTKPYPQSWNLVLNGKKKTGDYIFAHMPERSGYLRVCTARNYLLFRSHLAVLSCVQMSQVKGGHCM